MIPSIKNGGKRAKVVVVSLVAFVLLGLVAFAFAQQRARRVTVTMSPAGAKTIKVPAGGNLQRAINAAQGGDTIELEAGASFMGAFELPNKASGENWITIRSSRHAELPEGVRVSPAQSNLMPKLLAPGRNEPAIRVVAGAHHYRLVGLEIKLSKPDNVCQALVAYGSGVERSRADFPHHLTIDRSYLHGEPTSHTVRAVSASANHSTLTNSYVSEIHAGSDAQAYCSWTGDGPHLIENNYLEASGENIMFGGADPLIDGLVPSDIVIRRNHIAKPFKWRQGHPDYDGSNWGVKNLIEIKNGRRVLIEGNVIERSWEAGQQGAAVMLKATVQDNHAFWTVCEDVTVRDNIIRSAGTAFIITAYLHDYKKTRGITIENNLIYDVNSVRYGGPGNLVGTTIQASDVTIAHNTGVGFDGITVTTYDSNDQKQQNIRLRDNILQYGFLGVTGGGSPYGEGVRALQALSPGTWALEGNLWFNRTCVDWSGAPPFKKTPCELDLGRVRADYPKDFVVPTFVEVGFRDYANNDFRLTDASRYKGKASDGKDVGVDFARLEAAVRGVADTPPNRGQRNR